jgi:hypothetical protein
LSLHDLLMKVLPVYLLERLKFRVPIYLAYIPKGVTLTPHFLGTVYLQPPYHSHNQLH